MNYIVQKPTADEIIERFKLRAQGDFIGAEVPQYLAYLNDVDYARATGRQARNACIPSLWSERNLVLSIQQRVKEAFGYSNDLDEMKSMRAYMAMLAWMWLLGDRVFTSALCAQPFDFYGKPELCQIAERYGLDPKDYDDGVRAAPDDNNADAISIPVVMDPVNQEALLEAPVQEPEAKVTQKTSSRKRS